MWVVGYSGEYVCAFEMEFELKMGSRFTVQLTFLFITTTVGGLMIVSSPPSESKL
jgi:hypothetical protein